MPLVRDAAACSAMPRHAVAGRNRVSPSTHLPVPAIEGPGGGGDGEAGEGRPGSGGPQLRVGGEVADDGNGRSAAHVRAPSRTAASISMTRAILAGFSPDQWSSLLSLS